METIIEFFHDILRAIRRRFNWVIKSIHYSIVLWDDFDWDHAYILLLLKYKLKRTRENINKNANHVGYEKIVADIKTAENMIQTVLDDNFCMEEYEAHEKKWGNHCKTDWNKREKVTTPKQEKQERRELTKILKEMHRQEEKAWNDLFDFLKANMRCWWD